MSGSKSSISEVPNAPSAYTIDTNECNEGVWAPSISTNSTRSGIPGPGRNLDRLFSAVGSRLERAASKAVRGNKAPLFSDQQTPQALVLYRPHTHAHAHKLGDAGTSGESSISTNATQSNLPGPGRNLDRLYGHLGRNLVSFLSSLAHRTGWGPNAAERRIIAELSHRHTSHIIGPYDLISLSSHVELVSEDDWPKFGRLSRKGAKKVRKACKKLLHYTQ